MNPHTPGPWQMDYDRNFDRYNLRGRYSFGHFQGWSADGVTTEAEDKANARLIAAAPDLLNALELAVATIERLAPDHHGFNSAKGTLDVACAAIAKATQNHEVTK